MKTKQIVGKIVGDIGEDLGSLVSDVIKYTTRTVLTMASMPVLGNIKRDTRQRIYRSHLDSNTSIASEVAGVSSMMTNATLGASLLVQDNLALKVLGGYLVAESGLRFLYFGVSNDYNDNGSFRWGENKRPGEGGLKAPGSLVGIIAEKVGNIVGEYLQQKYQNAKEEIGRSSK